MEEREQPAPLRRILVYGVTGSGKTTLARQIGEATGLPWVEVDRHTWRPGWVQVPEAEQRRWATELCAGPAWVLDTAYAVWRDVPLARAELVVALDYPRWLSFGRLLRRSVRRAWTQEETCNGNVETFAKLLLSTDSILLWHLRSHARKRGRIRQMQRSADGPPVLRMRSPAATRRWLDRLRAAPASAH